MPNSSLAAPKWPTRRREVAGWLPWVHEVFATNPERGFHSRVVWQRVVSWRTAAALDAERSTRLELAALLHDVGRALDPTDAEPHGFVGARFLDEVGLTDVAPLVAHHSGTRAEAAARGLQHLDVWPDLDPELQALLDLADRTVDRRGRRVSLAERRRDLALRYGEGSRKVWQFDAWAPEAQRLLDRLERRPTATP